MEFVMECVIEHLLEQAEDAVMPDNSRQKAIQCQITLVGKIVAGALTRVAIDGKRIPGVYKLLSLGETRGEGQKPVQVLVECYINVDAIQSLDRVMPKPMIEPATLSIA